MSTLRRLREVGLAAALRAGGRRASTRFRGTLLEGMRRARPLAVGAGELRKALGDQPLEGGPARGSGGAADRGCVRGLSRPAQRGGPSPPARARRRDRRPPLRPARLGPGRPRRLRSTGASTSSRAGAGRSKHRLADRGASTSTTPTSRSRGSCRAASTCRCWRRRSSSAASAATWTRSGRSSTAGSPPTRSRWAPTGSARWTSRSAPPTGSRRWRSAPRRRRASPGLERAAESLLLHGRFIRSHLETAEARTTTTSPTSSA